MFFFALHEPVNVEVVVLLVDHREEAGTTRVDGGRTWLQFREGELAEGTTLTILFEHRVPLHRAQLVCFNLEVLSFFEDILLCVDNFLE